MTCALRIPLEFTRAEIKKIFERQWLSKLYVVFSVEGFEKVC
jgi:hypothetical protein